jgi:uncharacterized repeat protein (TIGR01451 family)
MTGLLSAISGQFSKALILGALFPAAIFVFLFLVFVAPLLPPEAVLAAPRVFGTDWNALSITFATLVLAGVLYNLDTPLIQLYEGYPWRNSLLGRWRTRVQRGRWETLRTRADVLYELNADPHTPQRKRLMSVRNATRRSLMVDFPDRADLVLPTRLGNILRSFERYPEIQYGMDAIYFWPRLVAVISPSYATALGDARTTLVFLLTLSFLTAFLCAATVAAGLAYLPPRPMIHVVFPTLFFGVASGWLYGRSFGAAKHWGDLVKGSFDLYRWELLKQMGFEQKPRTRRAERSLWYRITDQTMFGDEQTALDRLAPRIDYADPESPATAVAAKPHGISLEVSRGVEAAGAPDEMRVVIVVENRDESRTATGVVVTDRLPEGTAYRWNSATVGGQPVDRVTGTGPYRFHLQDIPAEGSAVLTFTVRSTHLARGS